MEDRWLDNVMKLLPRSLKCWHQQTLNELSGEMREDYHMSVKKAIVDFVLKVDCLLDFGPSLLFLDSPSSLNAGSTCEK